MSKLPQISEHRMHRIRWTLTLGWIGMILSLFWSPIIAFLPSSQGDFYPLNFDPKQCILVQGNCLSQKYPVFAIQAFWTLIVPGSILILLVLGHETWRRICPLSFLSQIPRSLGIQRKRQLLKSGAGATRFELVKIKKDSWLGKNHLYVQFGLLTIGLAARLLLLNSERIALGIFLLLTIGAALAVGYLYEGKSWCQFFCPMAPVQLVFTGPRGLLGSEAHQGQRQSVTQSMCRTVDKEGQEKSACVGCQSPCIDIDAERNYWETFAKPGRRFVQYGYVGLLLGFFLYYFLYSGSFDYLFSGAWLREANLFGTLFNPGFYLAGQSIPLPKLLAVPLTLSFFIACSYVGLTWLEKRYRGSFKPQQAAHILFALCTFCCFNLFFFFSSRSLLMAFAFPIHLLFNGFIVLVSTLWLSRTLDRSVELYSRESLAGSLRRQLSKLTINFSRFLEGRSMEDLKPEEVYVLAKVLPGFNQENSVQVYKGVLRETLEQGNTDSASSLEALRQIRQELNIKDEDHFTVLTELGAAEPELLDPTKRRTRESQLRIESYRQALASMLLDLVDSGMSLQEAMQRQKKQLQFLKLEYGMTTEEEEKVLSQVLAGEHSTVLRKAEVLLEQMQQLAAYHQVLSDRTLDQQTAVFKFLRLTAVQHKQQIITKQMLGLLEVLGNTPDALKLASATRRLAEPVVMAMLQAPEAAQTWKQRLNPDVLAVLETILPDAILPDAILPDAILPDAIVAEIKSVADDRPLPANRLDSESPSLTEASLANAPTAEDAGTDPAALPTRISPENVLPEILSIPERSKTWNAPPPRSQGKPRPTPQPGIANPQAAPAQNALNSPLTQPVDTAVVSSPLVKSLPEVLDELLSELDPVIQTLALYGLNLIAPLEAQAKAQQILDAGIQGHWLVKETAEHLLAQAQAQAANEVQTLIAHLTGWGKTEKFAFQQPVVRVGSNAANDLVLSDPVVAPYHAVFYLDGDGFSVVDLGNSVYIGHKHLQGQQDRLSQGAIVRFRPTAGPTLTLFWEKQPRRSQAPTEALGTLDKVLLLFESRFFRSLKPEALIELGQNATVKVYPRGDRMCQAGDPSDSILLLIDGIADVIVLRDDLEQAVGRVNVGETIGEMGVLTRQRRSASVVSASAYCRALVIQADKFDAVLRQDPEIARNLLVVLSSRLQSMTNKLKSAARVG